MRDTDEDKIVNIVAGVHIKCQGPQIHVYSNKSITILSAIYCTIIDTLHNGKFIMPKHKRLTL